MLRKWIYILYPFQDTLKSWKTNDCFNDSKRKRIALSGRGITSRNVDFESLIENVDGWKNNPEKLSKRKVGEFNIYNMEIWWCRK